MTNVDFETRLENSRKAWRDMMMGLENSDGVVEFPRAPQLRPKHVVNAELLADRYELVRRLKSDAVVAEIGVWRGDFADYLMQFVKPRELHLIDIDFKRFKVRERFASVAGNSPIFHEADSVDVLGSFDDEYFDWIYVDAGHSFDEVWRDADVARRKVKRGGTLVFNDYIFWSHTEARPYGVVQVVNKLCVEFGWQVTHFALHPAMYCDIAITQR